jgi:hypothetical protein
MHPHWTQIRGVVCGVRVEAVADLLRRQIRCLASGSTNSPGVRPLDRILRR